MKPSPLKNLNSKETKICNECGQCVEIGTGLFVNRVMDLNDDNTRIKQKKPFPRGAFICAECDVKIYS